MRLCNKHFCIINLFYISKPKHTTPTPRFHSTTLSYVSCTPKQTNPHSAHTHTNDYVLCVSVCRQILVGRLPDGDFLFLSVSVSLFALSMSTYTYMWVCVWMCLGQIEWYPPRTQTLAQDRRRECHKQPRHRQQQQFNGRCLGCASPLAVVVGRPSAGRRPLRQSPPNCQPNQPQHHHTFSQQWSIVLFSNLHTTQKQTNTLRRQR